MRTSLLGGAVLVLTVAICGPGYRAAAAELPSQRHHLRLHHRSDWGWPPREYWQWDSRPIWDDPWTALRPTIWGSPEPYLVPADIWACEWHLPAVHKWRRQHWRCPAWQ